MNIRITKILVHLLGMVVVMTTAQLCTNKGFECTTEQDPCVCKKVNCIPTINPCIGLTEMRLMSSTLSTIPSEAFANYSNLQSISILQEEDAVIIEENAFKNQNELKKLELNVKGSIKEDAFKGLDQLQIFSLKPNFSSVSSKTFTGLTASLRELTLSRGILSDVQKGAFVQFYNLTKLDLSFNKLTKIKSDWMRELSSLQELILTSNSITMIETDSFEQMSNLKKMDLRLNNLKIISQKIFTGLISITELNLSANKLQQIEAGSFRRQYKLQILQLNNNNLVTFSFSDLYQENSTLKALTLNNNNLTSLVFPTSPTIPLHNLKHIDLHSNMLVTFPTVVLDSYLTNLNHINMRLNPFICDCAMSNLSNHFTTFWGNLPDCSKSVLARCFAPSVETKSSNISAKIESNVILRCNILGQPYPVVNWVGPMGKSLIGDYNPYTGVTWLHLRNITTALLGRYECVASNAEGYNKAVITVIEHVEKEQLISHSVFVSTSLPYVMAYLLIFMLAKL
ncbi:leucine-rich repeats and immunoglobulin-like domains protein 2 [Anneissia japonica]|uniref:leucine-rich repeats and immunoglobulin-like domains protein 2 n=1 Tax=Anneissia japonica TaxID=1529436 RepID=UPI00142571B3|nr:leucine-rich repeats and immunoglobulin-like domains protein 2 [Anneissia japonica]XP_033111361.1 leucine-rich repeats and immunoglobulin-like domains protein 2 [Anneissia japonica]XP_033111362.1 leucine-rich repeats and immunoglobulin-like domains protein 2 [Anneissia japonica]